MVSPQYNFCGLTLVWVFGSEVKFISPCLISILSPVTSILYHSIGTDHNLVEKWWFGWDCLHNCPTGANLFQERKCLFLWNGECEDWFGRSVYWKFKCFHNLMPTTFLVKAPLVLLFHNDLRIQPHASLVPEKLVCRANGMIINTSSQLNV